MDVLGQWGDLGLLLLRWVIGGIFVVHGTAKLANRPPINGMSGWTGMLRGLGVPMPAVAAWGVVLLEVVGGALLLVGLGVRVLGALFAVNMLAATWAKLKWGARFTQFDGTGWEFDLLLLVSSLALWAFGGGGLGLDAVLGGGG